MSIAAGDGEGFEVATSYGSDRRRWFYRRTLSALDADAEPVKPPLP
jgi:hypothetical protein